MGKMAISIAISFEKQHILFSFDLLYTHDFSDYFKECLIVFVFYIASIFICQQVESLTAARTAAMKGTEPSDAIRVVNALLTQIDQIKR